LSWDRRTTARRWKCRSEGSRLDIRRREAAATLAPHPQPAGISSRTAVRSDEGSRVGNKANLPKVSPGISGASGTCQIPKMFLPELVAR
jgi:hypothetical protein